MSRFRAPLWLALVAVVCSLPSRSLAAGATVNWTDCVAPARLPPSVAPDKTWYVSSTSGTDPASCAQGTGYIFKTIQKAASCATGGETIYVYGGTYTPPSGQTSVLNLSGKAPSRRVLIASYPGQTVILSGNGLTPEWGSIINLQGTSNYSLQDLEIANTGKNGQNGSFGVDARGSSNLNFYYNTVHDISNNGIMVGGSNIKVIGNKTYHTASMRLPPNGSGFLNDAICTYVKAKHSNIEFSYNDVSDDGGECIGVYGVDGATISHNKIHDCMNVNLYVSASREVYVDSNWIYETSDNYDVGSPLHRAAGIQLAVETDDNAYGYPLFDVYIWNNLIERVGQGVRFWRRCNDALTPDPGCSTNNPSSYLSEMLAFISIDFNDFKGTYDKPVKFDLPRYSYGSGQPEGHINGLIANIGLHFAGQPVYFADPSTWVNDSTNFWADSAPSPQTPGWTDPDVYGYQAAYILRSDSTLKRAITTSGLEAPTHDYFCRPRPAPSSSTPISTGAYEY